VAFLDDEFRRRWRLGMRPGLERILAVLERLGAAGSATRILVAGTNGKGSTATFLDAVLRAHGVATGLYTSPHLVSAAERIRLDGVSIDDARVGPALAVVAAAEAAEKVELTGFEWITAVAVEVFRSAALPCWILEVGLGGRLDATNACDPDLSIITSVGLDHTDLLGDSLAAVAREKAGILRPGRVACLAAQAPKAAAALAAVVAKVHAAPVLREGVDWRWNWEEDAALRWKGPGGLVVGPVRPGLAGEHQGGNAALALAAAAQLLPGLTGQPMDPASAARGIAEAHLAGRFQEVRARGRRVLLDVAHNPHGAEALAASYGARWGRCPAALVALKDDKDAAGVLAPLAALTEHLICCPLPGAAHHSPEALIRACPGPATAEVAASPMAGIERLPVTAPGLPPPLVCGSHFLIGHFLGLAD